MNILITAVGTRGDVYPIFALGQALVEFGQQVKMCIPPNFILEAEAHGFEAVPIGIEMRPRQDVSEAPSAGQLINNQFEVLRAASEGCDAIVACGAHQYAAHSIADWRGIRHVAAIYAPVSIPALDHPPAGISDQESCHSINQRLWADHRRSWNTKSLGAINRSRAQLGLDPVKDVISYILSGKVVLAADSILGPEPVFTNFDVTQTGAWIATDKQALPAEVENFLQQGRPPIYVGFGSMPVAQNVGDLVIESIRATGRRAILSRGWARLASNDPTTDCLVVEEINHQALFPRVAAVVHHGGAGTTTCAASSGSPQLVLPLFSDQFYWGERVRALKIGTGLPLAELKFSSMVTSLTHILQPSVVQRARSISNELVIDGAKKAAQFLVDELEPCPN